jgi:putative ABC transport system permease protein
MSAHVPLGVRLYRRALRILPDRFRQDRGPAMQAMFEEEWHERRRPGRAALLATAILDLLRTALLERWQGQDSRTGPRRPRSGLAFSWLDLKLGVRMLFKQPGLTLVAVFALSVGIPASLIPIHMLDVMRAPLPFPDGDRIVGIIARNDFFLWRESLTTLEATGAARSSPFNVISEDGRAAPIQGAEITASAFEMLRVTPIAGRVLLDSDELPGAPDVAVIGYDVWQSRLAGDPGAVGSTIRIGTVPHQVVGIMPEGFLFPIRDYLWMPLRTAPADVERGLGGDILKFGRLADGVSLEQAHAEVSTIALSVANEPPGNPRPYRPRVGGYTAIIMGLDAGDIRGWFQIQLIIFALLAIVCGNVGTLILARTATRSGEISLRTALGASRSRVVAQLFVESLVLAVVSAGCGLLIGEVIGTRISRSFVSPDDPEWFPDGAPFWLDFGVTVKTAAIALSLAVFCAVIAGVLPALKATGARVQQNLQRTGVGSGIRFGFGATVLIVAEVALAVGFLSMGGALARGLLPDRSVAMAIEPAEFAIGMLRIPSADGSAQQSDLADADFRARVVRFNETLEQRLAVEPGVRGVAMGDVLPGMYHEPDGQVEVEGDQRPQVSQGYEVRHASVDVDFFEGLGAPIESGRDFNTTDLLGTLDRDRTSVIVNTAFVEHVLGGGNAIGRRVRYLGGGPDLAREGQEPSPWYEIVGVVGHLGMNEENRARDEGIYHPVAPGEINPIWTAVRVGEDPMSFLPRLRQIASEIDPDAMIQYPASLDQAPNEARTGTRWITLLLAFLSSIAIVLSGAGLYALMSFTVSQRTREIGIRTAVGARPGGIVATIARRAFLQLVGGVTAGVAVGVKLISMLSDDSTQGTNWQLMMAAIAGFVLLVGMLACLGPTLRALRIRPVEALREG